jgi:pentatricopeptide repeat protein
MEEWSKLDEESCREMLLCLANASLMNAAKKLFSRMKKRNIITTFPLYKIMIAGYSKICDVRGVINCYMEIKTRKMGPLQDYEMYGHIVRCIASEGEIDMLLDIFDEMISLEMEINETICTIAIESIGLCGNSKKVMRLFEILKEKYNIKEDIASLNALIGSFAYCGDVEMMMSSLQNMKSLGITPDVITFNHLMERR